MSLERLQANIIRAALPPNRAPVGVPLGAGVGAGGVARAAVQEAKGEEVLPPAELSCKVCVLSWGGGGKRCEITWYAIFVCERVGVVVVLVYIVGLVFLRVVERGMLDMQHIH